MGLLLTAIDFNQAPDDKVEKVLGNIILLEFKVRSSVDDYVS